MRRYAALTARYTVRVGTDTERKGTSMIGTPGCPDNCGCSTDTSVLAILKTAVALVRGIARGL